MTSPSLRRWPAVGGLLLVWLSAVGCASMGAAGGEDALLVEGSRLRLTSDLRVSPRLLGGLRPALWFQSGRPLQRPPTDRFQPACAFSTPLAGGGEQLVTADVFVVESVRRAREAASLSVAPTMAEVGGLIRVGDTPGPTTHTLVLALRSGLQGAGFSLRCLRLGDPNEPAIGPADLRQALGGYFELLGPLAAGGSVESVQGVFPA